MQSTREDPAAAGRVLVEDLLPLCLSEGGDATDQVRAGAQRLRELLHDWIEQYADEVRVPLRHEILARAMRAARGDHPKPALWTIAEVGFRTPPVTEALREFAGQDDDVGDAAINCLAALGPAGEERAWLVRQVLDRLPRRAPPTFDHAIQELAEPEFLPALEGRAAAAGEESQFVPGLLGRIADARPGDGDLQRRIWGVIERAASAGDERRWQVLFSGTIAASCDLARPVRALLGWLAAERDRRHLIYHRLEECVRPRQLAAWAFPAPRFCDRPAPGPRIRCLVRNRERRRDEDQTRPPTFRAAGNNQRKRSHWTACKPLAGPELPEPRRYGSR